MGNIGRRLLISSLIDHDALSVCAERRASVMAEEKPKADGKTATKEEEDMEIDTQSTRKKEKRKGLGKGKGQTSYGVSEGKKWFQMFPAITKRRKNHIKKKKGAVRG